MLPLHHQRDRHVRSTCNGLHNHISSVNRLFARENSPLSTAAESETWVGILYRQITRRRHGFTATSHLPLASLHAHRHSERHTHAAPQAQQHAHGGAHEPSAVSMRSLGTTPIDCAIIHFICILSAFSCTCFTSFRVDARVCSSLARSSPYFSSIRRS